MAVRITKQLFTILVLLFVFIGFIIIGNVSNGLYSTTNEINNNFSSSLSSLNSLEYPLPIKLQEKIIEKDLSQTREYSFKLNNTNLQPRTRRIGEIFDFIKDVAGFQFIENGIDIEGNLDYGKVSMRYEKGVSKFSKTCGSPDSLTVRFRNYVDGYNEGYQTLDVKKSYIHDSKEGQSPDKILELAERPLSLSNQYKDKLVIDKLEEDYHLCDSKFSRESRILLPSTHLLESCGDIKEIYPNIGIVNNNALFEFSPGALWWVWKVHGYTSIQISDNESIDVELESTFTLQYWRASLSEYKSIMNPITGDMRIPSSKSEWSLRIFSSNHGKSVWNPDVVKIVDSKFADIVKKLSEKELILPDTRYCGNDNDEDKI